VTLRSEGTLVVARGTVTEEGPSGFSLDSLQLVHRPYCVVRDDDHEPTALHCLHCDLLVTAAPGQTLPAAFYEHPCSDEPREITEGGRRARAARAAAAPRKGAAGADEPQTKEN
jgi:hypothetical protein